MSNKRVFFFDLLRCIAAVAVIAIHVLEPYRNQLNELPFGEWATAITINGFSRWAVPVFILITGALMLSDRREFNAPYYLKRRLGKVLVPFIIWSIFYAYLSGLSLQGFDFKITKQVLTHSYEHETYYHLGFFYYFIPLYFVIPFFQILVRKVDDMSLYAFLFIWLLFSTLFLMHIDGFWSHQLVLYSGYLLLGYVLYQKIPLTKLVVILFAVLGALALWLTVYMVITNSVAAAHYTVGRWLSYKTLNTVLAASMVFMVGRYFGEGLQGRGRQIVGFISTHSLGIYLLHPLFLFPMKQLGLYQGHPAWVIPLWIIISGSGALFASWLLSRSSKTSWLLP